MLRSYIRLALRTLRRRLGYTAVNVIGLTVGPAWCVTRIEPARVLRSAQNSAPVRF